MFNQNNVKKKKRQSRCEKNKIAELISRSYQRQLFLVLRTCFDEGKKKLIKSFYLYILNDVNFYPRFRLMCKKRLDKI